MKYNVHIYPIVHIKVEGIEADSQEEAVKKAQDIVDLNHTNFGDATYAEDIDGFFVDEEGDPEYIKSRFYDGDGNLSDKHESHF